MTDFDMPEFFFESYPRARKPHKCCECDAEIPAGDIYHRASGKWCDSVCSFKSCMPCTRLRDYMRDNGVPSCFTELHMTFDEMNLFIPAMVVLGMQVE